jgi:hypothetical protein
VEGIGEFGNFAELHVETSVAVQDATAFMSCVVVIVIVIVIV